MGLSKCAVNGCTANALPRHRFPHFQKDLPRFQQWLNILGNQSINAMLPADVYKKKLVCHSHFEEKYISPGTKRLHIDAVPTLFLNDGSELGSGKVVSSEKNIEKEKPCVSTISEEKECVRVTLLLGTAASKMTPGERKLYSAAKKISQQLKRMEKAKKSLKIRLTLAKQCIKTFALEDKLPLLNPIASTFIKCQLREAGRFRKQHRFTEEEKIKALSLFKQSPRGYRFLAKVFALPSGSTLNKFLRDADFKPGLNENIFSMLKKTIQGWNSEEKIIVLMWDEISLMPHFDFEESKGRICGFKNIDNKQRCNEVADHALVFMIRGLRKGFTQPISYHFTSIGDVKVLELKVLVRDILNKLLDIGFKPIATICDHATTNMKTLQLLMAETENEYFQRNEEYRGGFIEIRNFKIYPIYDPPHLLKGIRNNFLTKNIKFGCEKIAKWEHIRSLYEVDNAGGLKVLPSLTDDHVDPKASKQTKVIFAAQIFSQKVASTLNLISKIDTMKSSGEGANETAELLFFFDRLFDSVNGIRQKPEQGKVFRCGISDSSLHIRFWKEEAAKTLQSIAFCPTGSSNRSRPPSLKNWLFTLENFENIWTYLKSEGFEYMLGGQFNQDPLENFFGQIRSHGTFFNNPTPLSFSQIFRTMIINSSVSLYKSSFSCENDQQNYFFLDLNNLKLNSVTPAIKVEVEDSDIPDKHKEVFSPQILESKLVTLSNNYLAVFVMKKIRNSVSCTICTKCMFANEESGNNLLIKFREYSNGWEKRLKYPSDEFAIYLSGLFEIIHDFLKENSKSETFLEDLSCILDKIPTEFLDCTIHGNRILEYVKKISIRTIVHSWCRGVNRYLSGRDRRPYMGTDPIKIAAKITFYSRKKRIDKGTKIL